ncbi:hypothetical protein [Georhizobium profundi]|uniref:hypothetical protein n=1 Tax=Georhizobium profundi TaxID=2341112 RepID=UPI001FDF96B8|nr:hypothetical protein [Georhizobium profundi]
MKLDTAEPVELADFVGAFTSIANEFERFVKDEYPGAKADPRIYVREVRSGCIEADLITGLMLTAKASTEHMSQILILEDFVKRWGRRLKSLINNDVPPGELENSGELKDFLDATESIVSDPVGSHRLEAAVFEDNQRGIRASFEFSSIEARSAQQTIDDRRKMLAKPDPVSKARTLMVYTRTDVHDAAINKRSGERVIVRDFSPKDKPVLYASEMAEQEIRAVIREGEDNAYRYGFVVDVTAQVRGDDVIAYAVTNFHHTIELD